MSNDARSVLRNAMTGFTGQMVNLMVGLVSSVYIARVLGNEQFGMLNWAVGLCTIAASVANAGLDSVIVRDIARKRENAAEYLFSAFVVKVFSTTLCYLGLIAYLQVRHYSSMQLLVGYLVCSTVIAESFNASCRAVLVAMERQDITAVVSVVTNIIRILVVILLVYQGYNIIAVAWVTVGVGVLTLAVHLKALSKLTPLFRCPNYATARYLLVIGSSFFVSDVFLKLFDRVDYIMLDIYKDVGAVGIYAAAYRIIEIVAMIGYSCSLSLFPIISRRAQNSKEGHARAVALSTKYLTIFGIPLCVGIFLLSWNLMVGLYSTKYAASATCLSMLIWSRIAAFAILPGQQSVAARNAQLWLLPPVIIRTVVNLALNVYLIPRYSYIGASISMVITENAYFLASYLISFRGPERFNPVALFTKPVLATGFMALIILLLRPYGILPATVGGVCAYTLGLHVLGALDAEDKRLIWGLVSSLRRQKA